MTLKNDFKYLVGFAVGVVVALSIPTKATPDTLRSMQGTIVAQSGEFTNSSLRALATCLNNSGFVAAQGGTSTPVTSEQSNPAAGYIDGVINSVDADKCLNLRQEGEITKPIRCMPNGETVQVVLKDGSPVTRKYNGYEYVFVITYDGRGKGWAVGESIKY
jgi:hypothetical protein